MDKKQKYNELIKQGLKPSEALHILENEEQEERPRSQGKKYDEYGDPEIEEEKAYREMKENIQRKYGKVKAVVGEIRAQLPHVLGKKSLVKTGRFLAGAALLAPGDIRQNLKRNKEARKEYVRNRLAELKFREKELKLRKMEMNIGRRQIAQPQFIPSMQPQPRPQRPQPRKIINQLDNQVISDKGFIFGSSPFDLPDPFMSGNNPFFGKKKGKKSSDPFGLSGIF